jgi:hypothetical protein
LPQRSRSTGQPHAKRFSLLDPPPFLHKRR